MDDLSTGGACLALEHELAPGAMLTLGEGERTVNAQVCHVLRSDYGWLAGVKFLPETEGQAVACEISHLLDPQAVATAGGGQSAQPGPGVRGALGCLMLEQSLVEHEPARFGNRKPG
jgi:hypothetical protein